MPRCLTSETGYATKLLSRNRYHPQISAQSVDRFDNRDDFAETSRIEGICQPSLRDSRRIRAASRMKFGFRMIVVAFSSAESLRTNSDKQSIKRLPRQFTSS